MLGSVRRNRCQELHPPPCTALRLLASWAAPCSQAERPCGRVLQRSLPSWPGRGQVCAHLGYVADVDLHVAVLTGTIQPLHVHIQRPGDGERGPGQSTVSKAHEPQARHHVAGSTQLSRFTDEDTEAWQAEPMAQSCWDSDCRAWAPSSPWAALPKTATAPPPVAQPSPFTQGFPIHDLYLPSTPPGRSQQCIPQDTVE